MPRPLLTTWKTTGTDTEPDFLIWPGFLFALKSTMVVSKADAVASSRSFTAHRSRPAPGTRVDCPWKAVRDGDEPGLMAWEVEKIEIRNTVARPSAAEGARFIAGPPIGGFAEPQSGAQRGPWQDRHTLPSVL